jgi:hypothetical protein
MRSEEDKLAADVGLVDDLEREIAKCDAMIERQQALVAGIEANGGDGAPARILLEAVTEAKFLHQQYRQRVAIRIEECRL